MGCLGLKVPGGRARAYTLPMLKQLARLIGANEAHGVRENNQGL